MKRLSVKYYVTANAVVIFFISLVLCFSSPSFALGATDVPKISAKPSSINFRDVKVGNTSGQQVATVTNSGKSDLIMSSINLTGNNASEFSQTNNCNTLQPGNSCTVQLFFTPKLPFGKKSAVLSISSNDPKKPLLSVKLSGQTSPPKISSKPSSVNFGKMKGLFASITKTIQIKNTGKGDLNIISLDISGSNTAEFSQSNDCSTILPGSLCTVNLVFTPTLPFGNKSAVLSISSSDPKKSTINVKLSGTGPSDLSAPSIPQGLEVDPFSTSQINLSWDSSTDNLNIKGYKIFRDGSFLKKVVGATSSSDVGLSKNTQYCYTVSAYDETGNESGQSSQVCATTQQEDISWNLFGNCECMSCTLQVWVDGVMIQNIGYGDYGDPSTLVGAYNGTHKVGVYRECDGTVSPVTCSTVNASGGQNVTAYLDTCSLSSGTGHITINGSTAAPEPCDEIPTSGFIKLPKTGQSTSYYAGDDGDLEKGVAWPDPRVTKPDDSDCVTDELTGLMAYSDFDYRTWQGAFDYIKSLNSGDGACGYHDWRLPNVIELEILFGDASFSPEAQIDLSIWSSTTITESPADAAVWTAGTGYIELRGKSNTGGLALIRNNQESVYPVQLWKTGQIKCYNASNNEIPCTHTGQDGDIQAGVAWPLPRFTSNGDCVTDNLTGLMWAKNANIATGTKTWQQSLNYVSAMNTGVGLCGYHDWRLPNRIELFSLIDYSQSSPTLPSGHPFINVGVASLNPDESISGYWSSTTDAQGTNRAWTVRMGVYPVFEAIDKSNNAVFSLWPVRDVQ